MKIQFQPLWCLFLFSSVLFSCMQNKPAQENRQTSDSSASAETVLDSTRAGSPERPAPQSIEAIKKAYAHTMDQLEAHALDSVIMEYNCNNERQGRVVYYFHSGELTLIQHRYAEYDHHSATDHYFVQDSSLYFGLFSKASWMFIAQGLTQDNFTEQRTYIIDQQAVRCLEKQYIILSDQPGKRQEETENEAIPCSDTGEILSDFKQLLAFKDKAAPDCLEL